MIADKGCNRGPVWDSLVGQHHKRDVVGTTPLNFMTRGYTFVISKQNDLEQNRRIVSRTASFIVGIDLIEVGKIDVS